MWSSLQSLLAITAEPVISKKPELLPILEKICEPERQIMFRVSMLCQCAIRDCQQ